MAKFHSFFFLVWAVFHCIYIPHLPYPFYICSSVDEHLGCVQIQIGNCRQWHYEHWGACIFLISVFIFFEYVYPGVELLGQVVVLFLVFWEISILFSTVVAPSYISTNSVQEFLWVYILNNICVSLMIGILTDMRCYLIAVLICTWWKWKRRVKKLA